LAYLKSCARFGVDILDLCDSIKVLAYVQKTLGKMPEMCSYLCFCKVFHYL
jgi:hypothetical protein